MRPSLAHVIPTGRKGGRVVTTSAVNPGSLKVFACAEGGNDSPTATDDGENEGSNQRRETFHMTPKSVVMHGSHFLWKTRSLPIQVLFTSTRTVF